MRFGEELQAIQACSEDEECGQALIGTSCGCTRDLVARENADTATLMELLETEVNGRRCVELSGPCDGRCGWRYTDAPEELACQDTEAAELCVRGTAGADGETLSEGDALRIQTTPAGCWASGCTHVVVAQCSVSVASAEPHARGEARRT